MKRIAESILINQNITNNFLCHTWTADMEREIYGQVFVSNLTITGSATKTAWMEIQAEGSGTSCVGVPMTDATMVTGTTISGILFNSNTVPVYTNDIVKIYIKGAANDLLANVRTRIFDMNALRPTTTDRTLDVAATGETGLDFDNIKDATGAHTLTNITVPTTTNAGTVTGNVNGSVGSVAGNVAGTVNAIVDGYVTVTGTVNANVITMAADVITASALAASADAEIADVVWDELLAGHVIVGSAGAQLTAAGGATDPLLNAVPGTYAGGSAGAALGRIGTGQISTTSIVAQSGDVSTVRGDDYNNTDARRIDWTDVAANWPVLTTATILVIIGGDISFAGSVITATGANKKVGLELTAAQSASIPQGILDFVVVATLTSGRVVTLVEGKWTSKKQLVVGS